ncbi:hypothetical protein JCM3765_005187 [Sporobolomyces pararoseus]
MPPPLSSETYIDLYPTITFSLLSPVLEETTPHLDQLIFSSPPPPLPPQITFTQSSSNDETHDFSKKNQVKVDQEEEEEEEDWKKEEKKFAKIFSKFSFSTTTPPPPPPVLPPFTSTRSSGFTNTFKRRQIDLSPTMKESDIFVVLEEDSIPAKPKLEARTLPSTKSSFTCPVEAVTPVVVEIPDWVEKGNKRVGEWVENCEKARLKETNLVDRRNLMEDQSRIEIDPHPIYSRRRSTSLIVVQPPLQSTRSRTTTPSSSRPTSLVFSSGYISPYSTESHSLVSTPETSPTSSNFNNHNNNSSPKKSGTCNSGASSIRSTSSKISSLSNKVSNSFQRVVKFETSRKKRSQSESKVVISSSSPPPPVPSVPTLSLAQLVPLSAPIPAFLLDDSERKKLLSTTTTLEDDKGLNNNNKKKKRRDSMIKLWKEEKERGLLEEKLGEAFEKIERERELEKREFRKSFDL